MAKPDPTAKNDDPSKSARRDGTETDGTPADESHAHSDKEVADAATDRGAVNPDGAGNSVPKEGGGNEVVRDADENVAEANPGDEGNAFRRDGGMIDEDKVATVEDRVAADRQVDELESAIRDLGKAVGGLDALAVADPDRKEARRLEGTLQGRLRSLTVKVAAIARQLEADRQKQSA